MTVIGSFNRLDPVEQLLIHRRRDMIVHTQLNNPAAKHLYFCFSVRLDILQH